MGLFDKKYCDVCGEKIGLLGNRKLEDGNLCKDCAAKLSPYFTGRRHSTLNDIKSQLEAREKNKADVERFRISHKYGNNSKVLIVDADMHCFAVCTESEFKNGNPDIIGCTSITDLTAKEKEQKHELRTKNAEGHMVSYNPPRYEYSYDWCVKIELDHPYIDDIEFELNNHDIKKGTASFVREMNTYQNMCNELKKVLYDLGHGKNLSNPKAPTNTITSSTEAKASYKAGQISYKFTKNDYDIETKINISGTVCYKVLDESVFKASVSSPDDLSSIMSTPCMMAARKMGKNNLDCIDLNEGDALESELLAQVRTSQSVYGIQVVSVSTISKIEESAKDKYSKDILYADLTPQERETQRKAEDVLAQVEALRQQAQTKTEAPKQAENLVTNSYSADWECPACGGKGNTGKFCMFCGTARP